MAIEDLTTWTEVDPGTIVSRTASAATVTAGPASGSPFYVYKNAGVGFYSGNFRFRAQCVITAQSSSTARMTLLQVTRSDGGAGFGEDGFPDDGLFAAPSIAVRWNNGSLFLVEYADENIAGPETLSDSYTGAAVALNTTFYIEFERVGAVVTCELYSDSGYSTLVDTLTITPAATESMQYVIAACIWHIGSSATITGSVSNIDLDIGGGGGGSNAPRAMYNRRFVSRM